MRFSRIMIIYVIFLVFCSAALGQSVGKPGTVAPPPTRKTNAPVQVITKVVYKPVTPSTGRLFVAAEANAVLLVEPINIRNEKAQQGTVPEGRRDFIFNDLKRGRYRVAGTLAGYHPAETEVQILPNASESLTLYFQPVLYSVTINTNVATGEVKYGPEGRPLTNVESISNNKLQLSLPAGKYTIEIEPGEFGYETTRETFPVSDNLTRNITLNRNVESTDTLMPIWTREGLQEWEMPAGWQDSKRTLLVKGAGVALPREKGFRFYRDFQLVSNVRMTNGMGVSFALRARDNQNYYLLQLTGAKADEPHVVRLYLIKNGVARRIRAIPFSSAAARVMDSGQYFSVTVKMAGYQITVEINDSETGGTHSLGVLIDPDQNFAVGAVGIAARGEEEIAIERFVVCTGAKCTGQ
jgi:hypothetical protein